MWTAIITAIIPIAIKILNAYFAKVDASNESRVAYLAFLESMQKEQNTPAKLKTSYDLQIEALKNENARNVVKENLPPTTPAPKSRLENEI